MIAWGSEHADTLHDALAGAGWALTGKRRWLTVGQLPPLARTMAGVIAVAWRAGAEQAPGMTIGDALRQARADWRPAALGPGVVCCGVLDGGCGHRRLGRGGACGRDEQGGHGSSGGGETAET